MVSKSAIAATATALALSGCAASDTGANAPLAASSGGLPAGPTAAPTATANPTAAVKPTAAARPTATALPLRLRPTPEPPIDYSKIVGPEGAYAVRAWYENGQCRVEYKGDSPKNGSKNSSNGVVSLGQYVRRKLPGGEEVLTKFKGERITPQTCAEFNEAIQYNNTDINIPQQIADAQQHLDNIFAKWSGEAKPGGSVERA